MDDIGRPVGRYQCSDVRCGRVFLGYTEIIINTVIVTPRCRSCGQAVHRVEQFHYPADSFK